MIEKEGLSEEVFEQLCGAADDFLEDESDDLKTLDSQEKPASIAELVKFVRDCGHGGYWRLGDFGLAQRALLRLADAAEEGERLMLAADC